MNQTSASPDLHDQDSRNQRKAVQFKLSPVVRSSPRPPPSPELTPRTNPRYVASETSRLDGQSDPPDQPRHRGASRRQRRPDHPQNTRSKRHHHRRSQSESDSTAARRQNQRRSYNDSDNGSGETEVLPDRFDKEGSKLPERGNDPLADKLQDILQGRGRAGRLFSRFAGDLTGSSSSSGWGRRASR